MSFLEAVRCLWQRQRVRRDYIKATAENVIYDADEVTKKLNGIVDGNARVRSKAIALKRRVANNANRIEMAIEAMRRSE